MLIKSSTQITHHLILMDTGNPIPRYSPDLPIVLLVYFLLLNVRPDKKIEHFHKRKNIIF